MNKRQLKKALKKGFRGQTTKRTKPITTTVKKTQQAIKIYKPKKKAYSKPEMGKMPKPDMHVYGMFDGVILNKGLAGALNRVERDYPGTHEILNGWVRSGAITWDEVGKHFYRYYFEDRPEGVNFNYLIDQYAVYSEGYESFMTAVKELVEERQQNAI